MKKNPFGCFGFVSYIIIRLLLRQVGTGKDDRSELAFMGGGAVQHTRPAKSGAVQHNPPAKCGPVQHTPPVKGGTVQHTPPAKGGTVQHTPPAKSSAVQHTPPARRSRRSVLNVKKYTKGCYLIYTSVVVFEDFKLGFIWFKIIFAFDNG